MKKFKLYSSFWLGVMVSVFILLSFFLGGLADRLFVIKPLDYLASRSGDAKTQTNSNSNSNSNHTSLGDMMAQGDVSVAEVAAKASESVVTISIKTQQPVFNPNDVFGGFGFFGFSPENFSTQEVQQDIGTGFVVEGNLVVTNKHVVSNLQAEYKVIDAAEKEYQVGKIYRDPLLDLAILQVGDFSAPALGLGNSDTLRVGESVIAIGTALGQFRHTVTTGVISGVGRSITAGDGTKVEDLQDMIQTDAAINPGNSGGPLINERGEVIGVNVATAAADNISFAIPINVVNAAINNFNETGQFDRPMLGVSYMMISAQAALVNEIPQGAYLVEVNEQGAAAQAGLKAQDIIVEFDQQKLTEGVELAQLINQQKIGKKVVVKYWRSGDFSETTVIMSSNQE